MRAYKLTLSTMQKNFSNQNVLSVVVFVFAVFIMSALIVLTWGINFWPTDAEVYYLPTAVNLPHFPYISQMHEMYDTEKIKWLHGKEMFVVHTAIFQYLLNDYKSLRPLIMVCILSFGFSGILIFHLIRRYWGAAAGSVCFLLFMTSAWPYVYILFVKHQPLGLFYFLLALFVLQYAVKKEIWYFFSALFLCLSLYSSTISVLYLPFYLAGFLHFLCSQGIQGRDPKGILKYVLFVLALCVLGFTVPFIYFNYPDIIRNIKGYLAYAAISSRYNHFFYNQPVLRQWVEHPELSLRGGWVWVIKYFSLIMPVVFPLYLSAVGYLVVKSFGFAQTNRKYFWTTITILLLSCSPPILAEIKQVAQYGANYFASLIGILMLTGYSVFIFLEQGSYKKWTAVSRRLFGGILGALFALHVMANGFMFFKDLYPTRMMTTFLSDALKTMGASKIYTYMNHPSVNNVVGCLSPALTEKLGVMGIDNIYQADTDGYIIVPPVTGDSIYLDVTRNTYNDYDRDIFLNDIIRRGVLKDYAVASFDALPSSRIWLHEEEVLSYRALMLGHFKAMDPQKTKVWLLDPKKLWQDAGKNKIRVEYAQLIFNNVRNIGTKSRIYMYDGEQKEVDKLMPLKSFVMRLYKVGSPSDGLVAYIYKLATDEPVWIPLNKHFQSEVLSAGDISSDPHGEIVSFKFPERLLLKPGPYKIVIYRVGPEDDNNFYRVYMTNPEIAASYMKATDILNR